MGKLRSRTLLAARNDLVTSYRSIWPSGTLANAWQNKAIVRSFIDSLDVSEVEFLEDITARSYIAWVDKLILKGQSAATVRKKVSTLKSWVAWAEVEYDISLPNVSVRLPKVKPPKCPVLTYEDLMAAKDYFITRGMHDMTAAITGLVNTGMRINELFSLETEDIGTTTVAIYDGKGGKDRLVPITHHTSLALRYLVSSGLTKNVFRVRWREMRALLGWDANVVPHTLRHTYATRQAEGGTSIEVIAEILGHSDISTTRRYIHVSQDRLRPFARDLV